MLNTWIKIGAITARFPLENPFSCYIKTTLTFACDNLIPFCANACASRCTTRSLVVYKQLFRGFIARGS